FQQVPAGSMEFEDVVNLAERSIFEASAVIKEEASARGISGMGTTVVVICFDQRSGNRACALHVGDSRLYCFRRRELMQLTTDHSLAAESGIRDSDMVPMFMAGVITRAVGVRDDVLVDRTPVEVKPGDFFLLCSDGLYNMVPSHKMAEILSLQSLDPAADLVNAANRAGGFDNITVIVLEVLGPPGNSLDDTVT
ncbi:MAG: PP2C family protein-serine/threonine phosphatase, partial [Kiritimatiellia bacterium]